MPATPTRAIHDHASTPPSFDPAQAANRVTGIG
jgi:hypothetical protein